MLTPWSSEAGYEFLKIYKSNLQIGTFITSAATSILLLTFTMVYLQIAFLLLWRSKRKKQITFDAAALTPTLDVLIQGERENGVADIIITGLLMIVYVFVLIGARVVEEMQYLNDTVLIKYSTLVMLICLVAFVCPNNCSHLNYFLCREPNSYKMSPSILPWSAIPKLMPWNYFLVYGSSLAYGMALEKSGLPTYLMEHLEGVTNNMTLKLMGFMVIAILLTLLGANHLVARVLMMEAVKWATLDNEQPLFVALALCLTSTVAFLLPVSSVSNCFTAGWGNLKSKDMIIAGVGPTLFGYFLILGVIELQRYFPLF
ncbi:protein I'm not dead yet-like [Musca domestica]|nr:protein I'm not dead yet-like [Musca domestica]